MTDTSRDILRDGGNAKRKINLWPNKMPKIDPSVVMTLDLTSTEVEYEAANNSSSGECVSLSE